MNKIIHTVYSDRDSRDRQFKWSLFEDGSALSEELTWHTGDPARPVKVTWEEFFKVGSEMADMIAKICLKDSPSLQFSFMRK